MNKVSNLTPTKHTLQAENERRAAKINAYWKERGVVANARVELRTVPVNFKFVTVKGSLGFLIKKRIELESPEMVRSYEIVSDLVFDAAGAA